jgi:hypothetical protein
VNFFCEIEIYGTYQKQTYANRCNIAVSNGVMPLIIPVENQGKTLTKDVKISNHFDWQTLHFRALQSAYRSSPFFEYYADELSELYRQKFVYLVDFNINLQDKILQLLNYQNLNISLSTTYKKSFENSNFDLREVLLPKKKILNLPKNLKKEYYQVFSVKLGFMENLSVFDLLFNMGNEARIYLLKSIGN